MRWCVRTAQLAPGSAGIALECERASLTPQTPFRARCLVDHAGARSGVSIPTRTSIRWGEGPGRGARGQDVGAAHRCVRGPRRPEEDGRPCCGRECEVGGGERVGVRRSREDARERAGGRSDIQGRLDPHRRRIRPSLGGSLRMECIFLARALLGERATAARRRTESTMAQPARRAPPRGRRACAREGGPWGGRCAPRRERAAPGRRKVATGGTLGECSVSAVRSDRDNWMFGGSRHRASAVAGQ